MFHSKTVAETRFLWCMVVMLQRMRISGDGHTPSLLSGPRTIWDEIEMHEQRNIYLHLYPEWRERITTNVSVRKMVFYWTQRMEVTIPGVNKLGTASVKTASTSGYTQNNQRLFHFHWCLYGGDTQSIKRLFLWLLQCIIVQQYNAGISASYSMINTWILCSLLRPIVELFIT